MNLNDIPAISEAAKKVAVSAIYFDAPETAEECAAIFDKILKCDDADADTERLTGLSRDLTFIQDIGAGEISRRLRYIAQLVDDVVEKAI